MVADIRIENHGSIFLLKPITDEGEAWLADNIFNAEWWCGAPVVEPRYVADIVHGAVEDGLEVR